MYEEKQSTQSAENIHICYAMYDAKGSYSKYIGTSVCSLLENTSANVIIHILHDNTLTADNKNKFIELVNSYKQKLEFHHIKMVDNVYQAMERTIFSPASLYRFFIPEILSENTEKAIYLDADILVNLDIRELWNEPLNNAPVRAVLDPEILMGNVSTHTFDLPEFQADAYFNSGVMILNLTKIRNEFKDFFETAFTLIKAHPEWTLPDQDALNVLFNKSYLPLPYKYNKFVFIEKKAHLPISSGMYHYVGITSLGFQDNPHNDLFWQYFAKTPWFNIKFCTRALNYVTTKFLDNISVQTNSMLAICNAKHRIFVVENEVVKNYIKELFQDAKMNSFRLFSEDKIQYKIKKDTLIVFVINDNAYFKVKNELEQNGYKEFENFINLIKDDAYNAFNVDHRAFENNIIKIL